MCLEIKRLETCISGFYSDVCAYINLDNYADKDSVKCKIANIGEEIIPDMFSYGGTPYFSYNTFKKYSNGNHYARIYVEVEYKEKELELNEYIFNTAKGIDDYILDLDTLHHIMNIRAIAHEKKNIKLNEFVWRGLLKFDQFGQTMFLSEQEYTDNTPYKVKNGTVEVDTFRFYCKRWSGTFRDIPEQNNICPQCGEKWTIDNITDCVTIEQEKYKRVGYHKNCLRVYKNKEQLKEFETIFSNTYNLSELKFKAIKNEYCQCEHCASWFIISTPDGDIKIGWRKRVINIEWLENYKSFTETFESEDVTKGFGKWGEEKYIHAWGIEKAIEYIKRARESILP
jgi:hypothetical protein